MDGSGMRDGNGTGFGGFMRLHDIAAAFGDGLIPELFDLVSRPPQAPEPDGNVVLLQDHRDASLKSRETAYHHGQPTEQRR